VAETYWPTTSTALDSAVKWRQMASTFSCDGVIRYTGSELVVFADSSGMLVKLPTGAAIVAGSVYNNDAQRSLAVGNGTSLPRIDRAVLRYTFSNGVIAAAVKAGTPNASPTPPTLQRDASIWEVGLAQVAVAANRTTSIAANEVTDERPYAGGRASNRMVEYGGTASGFVSSIIAAITVPAQGNAYRLVVHGNLLISTTVPTDLWYVMIKDGGTNLAGNVNWASATVLDSDVVANFAGSGRPMAYLAVTGGGMRSVAMYLQRSTGIGTASCVAANDSNRLDVEIVSL
jgi:hypothetical protein